MKFSPQHLLVTLALCRSALQTSASVLRNRVALHTRRNVCKFKAFVGDSSPVERQATSSNVVFREGAAAVVQISEEAFGKKGLSRYLVFKKSDGTCHEEALVRCYAPADGSTSDMDKYISQVSQDSSDDLNLCSQQLCQPMPELSLSYARSMVSGMLAAMETTKSPKKAAPAKGLLIGIGGGMIPLWVQETQSAQMTLDAVDVDPAVLKAAPCFGLASDSQSNVHLHLEDGRRFLNQQGAGQYNYVLLDAFTPKDVVPPCLTTKEFMEEVKKRLAPDGVFIFNTWLNEYGSLMSTVSSVFRHIKLGRAPGESGNRIILASEDSKQLVGEKLQETVQEWYYKAQFEPVDGQWMQLTAKPRADADWCSQDASSN